MKPLPLILLNALVTLGIVIGYDQIQGEPTTPPAAEQSSAPDNASIEARLRTLEAEQRPMLDSAGDTGLADRLAALEARMNAAPSPTAVDEREGKGVPQPRPGMVIEGEGQVSPESMAEFKKIIHQVKREERAKKIRKRTDKALAKLELELDEATRQKLAQAYADFERRREEVWTEVKQNAAEGSTDTDWALLIADTQARLAGEFQTRIANFVRDDDAGEIATALFPASGSNK